MLFSKISKSFQNTYKYTPNLDRGDPPSKPMDRGDPLSKPMDRGDPLSKPMDQWI